MRKVAIPLAILALIGLDQWVKHWVVANIALNQVIKAIPGLFSLTYLQTVVLPFRFYRIRNISL